MSVRAPRRIAALIAVPTALAAGVVLASPAQGAPKDSEPTYKGSALALRAQVGLAGSSVLDEILTELVTFPSGGKKALIELPEELKDVVGLKVLSVLSDVKDGKLESNAHTAGLNVLAGLVTARVINADCTADGGTVAGDSQIADLALAGTKSPVDAGPNTKIEIPAEFASFLSGGITIDEQTETDGGGLRVRALHINLVVAPAALEDALKAVSAAVRAAAEQVKVALEAATGKSLDSILGLTDAKPAKPATQKSRGANATDRAELRAEAAAPKAAAPKAATESTGSTETTGTIDAAAPGAEAQAAEAQKSDGAEVDRKAVAGADATETDEAAVEAAEDAAAAQRAEQAEKGARAGESDAAAAQEQAERAAASDAAIAEQQAATAEVTQQRESARAESTSKNKSADLKAPDRAAAPTVDSDVIGALGVDVVVSEVTCSGKDGVVVVDEVPPPDDDLPDTGANGNAARDIAVTGLGLLAAGSAAVLVTVRRRRATV